ncbi:MAG TPA: pimeloyl-[acyl-carrier protein] methyl ester esterase [Candidatus Tenderia electrophaga]|uniref:Pimeloyl-[acyl-carrier protein] methyl ester esterase n=1 Tax=Candidatus Tenderia electrophaga TaxID=1748243 RepID=A0A832N3D6_9GAMM|nr:pimeloyl-[acyl-carrier protein] methyl ester esterase [Candidatus Tenderia electrophaga]
MSLLHTDTFGQGPDLVLSHGWGLHSGIWQPIVEALQNRYRLTTIDLPGHGYSPVPAGGFDLNRMSQLMLDAAPANATWIGWSLGGMAALNAALHWPQQINKVVMVAAQPQFVQSDDWPYATPADSLAAFSDNLVQNTEQTLKRFLGLQVRGSADEKQLLRGIRSLIEQRPLPQTEALRLGLEILKSTNLRPQLNQLQCPLQFILGERDMLVPVATAKKIQALLPQARIDIIKEAGHTPFLSHTDQFLALLENL